MKNNKITVLCVAFCIAFSVIIEQPVLASDDLNLKNFMLSPESKAESFEDDSIMNGSVLMSDFLQVSETAYTSRIETEPSGNKFFVLEDSKNDDQSAASLFISPVGDVAYDKCVLSFDFSIPDISILNAEDGNGEYLRLSVSGKYNDSKNSITAAYFSFMIQKSDKSQFIFQIADGTSFAWLGERKYNFDRWYTVRYELNFASQIYNIYLYDRDTKALVSKAIGRKMKTDAKKYRLVNFKFQVNAQRNEKAMSVKFDNISVAREQFLVNNEPVIELVDDMVTATVEVNNQTFSELQSPVLALAIYNKKNELVDVAYDSVLCLPKEAGIDEKPKAAILSCALKKPRVGEGYTAKAIVLNSLYNAKPYTSTATFKLQ